MKDLHKHIKKFHIPELKDKLKQEYIEKFGSNSHDYAKHLNEIGYSSITSCDNSLSIFSITAIISISVGPDGIDFFLEV